MNNPVRVTILMPVYKVEQYLAKTLSSVFTQTYPDIDFVFVNDCSPDNSLQVLTNTIDRYGITPYRYVIVNHKDNEGIAVSRADCIARATGDYVFFVDSDDWVEPDAVEQMVEATKGGTIDIVGCDYAKDFQSGEVTFHHENYSATCRENMLKCLNYDIGTVLWKLLIKRSLFDNITITPHVDIVEDYIISVKLYYYAKSFAAISKAFYHYVQYNQARVSLQTLWSVRMHIEGVKEVEEFCREKGLYDDYVEQQLNLRKFNIKSNFLTKQLLDYEAYKTTFPESNHAWRGVGYKRKEQLKFWLAEHGLFCVLKFLQG
jgi:glycosyltransferase involved in cell wall biosynthesis